MFTSDDIFQGVVEALSDGAYLEIERVGKWRIFNSRKEFIHAVTNLTAEEKCERVNKFLIGLGYKQAKSVDSETEFLNAVFPEEEPDWCGLNLQTGDCETSCPFGKYAECELHQQ